MEDVKPRRGGCTKGMTGCRIACGHRATVLEYRLARYNAELERDRVTLQFPTEERLFHEEHGPLITFRDWLVGLAQPQSEASVSHLPAIDQATADAWAA